MSSKFSNSKGESKKVSIKNPRDTFLKSHALIP